MVRLSRAKGVTLWWMTTVELLSRPTSPTTSLRSSTWWRGPTTPAVGQIYLLDNPLLHEPLKLEHTKPRLLGHWGTTPGLNFVYAITNRVIRRHGRDAIFVCGPGHGGPVVASTFLEGNYTELYPHITRRSRHARCSTSSRSPVVSRATPRPRLPVRSTKGASSATPRARIVVALDNPDLLVAW